MLFWIMLPATFIILLVLHYSFATSTTSNGNLMLGVTVPKAQRSHPALQQLMADYKKSSRRLFWVLFVVQGVGFFLRGWVTFSLVWCFGYIFGIMAAYALMLERYRKKVIQLKQTEGWAQGKGAVSSGAQPQDLQEAAGELPCQDEDAYWTAYGYCNPHDSRVCVPKRFGVGTTINLATKAGKRFQVGVYGFVLVALASVLVFAIPCDFGTVDFAIEGETVSIGFFPFHSEFSKKEIVSIALLNELPSAYKTNGSATERVCVGDFSVNGYGGAKMYVMRKVPAYMVIELADGSCIFANGVDEATTQNYYQQLGGE